MPRKRPTAHDQLKTLRFVLDTSERLVAPGKRSHGNSYTVLEDLVLQVAHSARPDGFPSSTLAQGVVLTKPAGQPGLRTHPEDPKSPPHEKGYSEDTTVEKMAEARMNDTCDQCEGTGQVKALGKVRDDKGEWRETWPTVPCHRCNGTGRRYADPQAEAWRDISAAITEMGRWAAVIDRKLPILLNPADNLRGRQSSLGGNCDVCGEFVMGVPGDQLKSKFCPSCLTIRDGYLLDHPTTDDPAADRRRFKEWMQKRLAEQEKEAVPS